MAFRILAVNGSYKRGGIIDQAVEAACAAARAAGAETETLLLSDTEVNFCRNCRACMQAPGEKRGDCVQKDGMAALFAKADAADALILAAPVNFFNVNAVTRRFMERLAPGAYWPWGAPAPKMRLKPARKAALITSSAMPSLAGRLATGAVRALKAAAQALGAKPAGTLFIGMAAMAEDQRLSGWDRRIAERLGGRLAAGAKR
jgi:NAD(P)H-dependent FMN reductase